MSNMQMTEKDELLLEELHEKIMRMVKKNKIEPRKVVWFLLSIIQLHFNSLWMLATDYETAMQLAKKGEDLMQ